jgi:hypothetical protein
MMRSYMGGGGMGSPSKLIIKEEETASLHKAKAPE